MSYKALIIMATLSLLLGASSTNSNLGPHPITFETDDGILIHGWYIHTGAHDVVHTEDESFFAQYSAVVLLHAYRGSKEDWVPIIREFFDREVAALAIDMRGHGDSTVGIDGEDLSIRVRDRDEPLFNSMWQDATAAVDWLVSKGHRKDRIAILGASVGCSVAIDTARRDPELRVVGVLSPGAKYLGVDTLAHLENWDNRSLLIVSSEGEWENGAKKIKEQLESVQNESDEENFYEVWQLQGTSSEVHGTRMLDRVEGIENRLLDWFELKLRPTNEVQEEKNPKE